MQQFHGAGRNQSDGPPATGEMVGALVEWAVSRGWTAQTSPDGGCHFYDPQGKYVAYWPSKTATGLGHRW
ncbi:hypothetical protein MARA_61670 [Mycolicibacterium arabiense]|jgi:hypothetical protein|uniref:Uncharacterized protein n=1 Tax=Mycolicibacterium arabiense TaxID=1286181 RepID=A0A7I7S8Q8_9MYCO|nr:hypothetical protein MARA_61670 [Mycolicibacterium arabiense]